MTIRVLVAEDNQALRESLGVLLPCRDIEPTLCADAGEFLQMVQESIHSYDAMIIDVSLPDMSGWQLLSELRRAGHQQPVVMCSGSPAPAALPCDCRFIMKPFPPHDLIELLQQFASETNQNVDQVPSSVWKNATTGNPNLPQRSNCPKQKPVS